jgi:type II secretory pathway component GspD/PulD (secretin)
MKTQQSFVAIVGALIAFAAVAQSLEIIDLRYRNAAEVIPLVKPLLDANGAITGQDYKLFVRTSAANLAQVKRALAEIDREPRQLRVLVRDTGAHELAREQASVSGTLSTGGGSRATVRAGALSTDVHGSDIASVLVLEGGAAFVSTGESVPIVTSVAVGGGRRPFVAAGTEYRNLNRGFLVTPRVNGERVVIDIEQHSERASGNSTSNITTGELRTQASGRLGEWFELGRVEESATPRERTLASGSVATRRDARSVWIRVELAN